jgi:hypothetical protein
VADWVLKFSRHHRSHVTELSLPAFTLFDLEQRHFSD